MISAMWAGMTFPWGYVSEIRVERPVMETTAFGMTQREFVPAGPARVSMSLELTGAEQVERVLRALGATEREVAEVGGVLRRGAREVRL